MKILYFFGISFFAFSFSLLSKPKKRMTSMKIFFKKVCNSHKNRSSKDEKDILFYRAKRKNTMRSPEDWKIFFQNK